MILDCLEKTETCHFADDNFIMFGSKTLATIETVVNHELKVTKWLRLNKLSLHAGKTELIFFHSEQRSLNYDIPIKFNGVRLIPVGYVKYLAMFIGIFMFFNMKLGSVNGILSKLRHYAPVEICLQVY